jgi:transcriptional regulator with XRE-family HTH domain
MPDLAEAGKAIEQFYREVGGRIEQARRDRATTQQDLASAVGLSRASIANVESGKQRTPAHILLAISQVLVVDAAWLLLGDGGTEFARADLRPAYLRGWEAHGEAMRVALEKVARKYQEEVVDA